MQYANSMSLLVSGLVSLTPLPPSSHEIPMGIFFPGWKLLVYIEYRLDTKKLFFCRVFMVCRPDGGQLQKDCDVT